MRSLLQMTIATEEITDKLSAPTVPSPPFSAIVGAARPRTSACNPISIPRNSNAPGSFHQHLGLNLRPPLAPLRSPPLASRKSGNGNGNGKATRRHHHATTRCTSACAPHRPCEVSVAGVRRGERAGRFRSARAMGGRECDEDGDGGRACAEMAPELLA